MLAEDIPDLDFHFSQIWLSAFVNDLQKTVGRNYKKVLAIYHGDDLKFYYGSKDSDDFARHILSLIVADPAFGEKINQEIRHYSVKLKKAAASLNPAGLASLSNKKLVSLYLELDKLHTTLYSWGWLPNAVDMFHENFTGYLRNELAKLVKANKISEVLVALSSSPKKSVIDEEQDSFLNLVKLKQAGKDKFFESALKRHTAKYFYLKHLWLGKDGVYDEKYYLSEIKSFIASGQKAVEFIKYKEKQRRLILKKRSAFIKKFKIKGKLLKIFNIYAEFSVTKAFRRDAQLLWAYKMDFFFAELSRRLRLPLRQCRFILPTEIVAALRKGKIDKSKAAEVKARSKACVYYGEKNVEVVEIGAAVKRWEKRVTQEVNIDLQEIKGQPACLGRATGIVRIVNSPAEMKKLKAGDILVSIATNPDIVPAMKIAGAIVTEQGGITSHAAIVSRELNIPCIIGTKIATQVLKDGDLVEVDAEKGVVMIIKKKK